MNNDLHNKLKKLEAELNYVHREYKEGNVPYSRVLEKSEEYRTIYQKIINDKEYLKL